MTLIRELPSTEHHLGCADRHLDVARPSSVASTPTASSRQSKMDGVDPDLVDTAEAALAAEPGVTEVRITAVLGSQGGRR